MSEQGNWPLLDWIAGLLRELWSWFLLNFLLPGVNHSVQGPGPAPTRLVESLVSWVEEGKAVEMLHAEQRDQSGSVIRTRSLYPYPRVARNRGRGKE